MFKMSPKNNITPQKAEIYLDEYNATYFENSVDGRETMLDHLNMMGMTDEINAILDVWGDAPTVFPTVLELKTEKLNDMCVDFEQRVSGAFTTSQGYLMQFSPDDSIKMQGAVTLLEATGQETGYITQANDETIPDVPLSTMKAVMLEMIAAFAQCHARKQELRALINAAQNEEELAEIVISWPV